MVHAPRYCIGHVPPSKCRFWRVTHVMVISWTLPSFLPSSQSLPLASWQLLGHCLQCWLILFEHELFCHLISFVNLLFLWCGVALKLGSMKNGVTRNGMRHQGMIAFGSVRNGIMAGGGPPQEGEKKLVPCRDGTTPYHIIPTHNTSYNIVQKHNTSYNIIPNHIIPYHIIPNHNITHLTISYQTIT